MTRTAPPRRWLLAVALVPLSAGAAPAENPRAGEPPDPGAPGLTASQRRDALVARSAWEHARLETLEAAFVQRKESPMLLEPERSEGSFSYRAPGLMRWDFVHPEVTVTLSDQAMVTWYRDLGRAERTALGRRADKLLRLLGPGASLADLERYFALAVEFPADAAPYRVRLEPRSARVARRLRGVDMELDRQLFVPVLLRLTEPDGGTTELRFDDLRINGEVPADRFELDLPDGVEVTPPPRPPS